MMRRHQFRAGVFDFEAGGRLDSMEVVFYTSPRPYRAGEKVIWINHALTANADPEDWWPEMVGEGKVIDPSRHFVVCVATLGSSYSECGPASVNPATGRPWLLDFPKITIRDMVNVEILVRKYLGIEAVDLLIGPSIGGFRAIEWTIMEPEVIRNAVFIATEARITPYISAYNESQRMAIKADPTFLAAKDVNGGAEGLKCARSIALISYRSYACYNDTQAEEEETLFAEKASSYQRYQGEKLVRRGFDAYSYWYLIHALDSMNPGRGRGGMKAALGRIKADCTLVAVETDNLFPVKSVRGLAEQIKGSRFFEIKSEYGHDGFLIESGQLSAILSPIVRNI